MISPDYVLQFILDNMLHFWYFFGIIFFLYIIIVIPLYLAMTFFSDMFLPRKR